MKTTLNVFDRNYDIFEVSIWQPICYKWIHLLDAFLNSHKCFNPGWCWGSGIWTKNCCPFREKRPCPRLSFQIILLGWRQSSISQRVSGKNEPWCWERKKTGDTLDIIRNTIFSIMWPKKKSSFQYFLSPGSTRSYKRPHEECPEALERPSFLWNPWNNCFFKASGKWSRIHESQWTKTNIGNFVHALPCIHP